jgi:hypothetical protein
MPLCREKKIIQRLTQVGLARLQVGTSPVGCPKTAQALNKVTSNAIYCVSAVRILHSHFEKTRQAAAATQGTEDINASGRNR